MFLHEISINRRKSKNTECKFVDRANTLQKKEKETEERRRKKRTGNAATSSKSLAFLDLSTAQRNEQKNLFTL